MYILTNVEYVRKYPGTTIGLLMSPWVPKALDPVVRASYSMHMAVV